MSDTRRTIAAVILTLLIVCAAWMGSLFRPGAEVEDMSSEDHPDWWRPIGGQNSQDSILERRSLMWNDNGIVGPTVPATFYEAAIYKGKFFTRGCRGMLEQLQLYCIGDGVDEITLRYSPHPCLGPINEVTIVPAAAWAWQDFDIEEMWNYDSLFIWVYEAEADVDWAYDAVLPFDGHESADIGATWSDMAIRPFIRAVYTGETPGDVPVSGIINNIPIPSISSEEVEGEETLTAFPPVVIAQVEGAGYVDMMFLQSAAAAGSEGVTWRIRCDDNVALVESFPGWNGIGFTASTPRITELAYAVNGDCAVLITKRFEFRRSFVVEAGTTAAAVIVRATIYPTLLR